MGADSDGGKALFNDVESFDSEAGTDFSEWIAITDREKQFSVALTDAEDGADEAVVEIYQASVPDIEKAKLIATITVTGNNPVDFTEIVESLQTQYIAKITTLDSGKLSVFADY